MYIIYIEIYKIGRWYPNWPTSSTSWKLYLQCQSLTLLPLCLKCHSTGWQSVFHSIFSPGKAGQCFWHLLSMDGLEIAANTMCSTYNCPACECPKDELDRTNVSYHLCSFAKVKSLVGAAQEKLELKWDPTPYWIWPIFNSSDQILPLRGPSPRPSRTGPHSAGIIWLLGLGRGKYNNILQQI